jgi:splicing factor 45
VSARPVLTSSLADWTGNDDDDVNGFYGAEKRQRGGRKRRKKNRRESNIPQNWDDVYDPSRPNNYEEYKNSDERIREIREWKNRLYAHRRMRRASSEADSDDDIRSNPYLNSKCFTKCMSIKVLRVSRGICATHGLLFRASGEF